MARPVDIEHRGKQMNERVIKIAHAIAIGILMLVAVVVTVG